MAGSQDFAPDPRNETVLVWVNGELTPRGEAKVSVFDAGFSMGDGVWEGLRLHKGALLFLDEHLDRLSDGASAIGLRPPGRRARSPRPSAANAARQRHDRWRPCAPDGDARGQSRPSARIRATPLAAPTIAITAEHKRPRRRARACASPPSVRCTPPTMFDMRLNSHSRLNLIIALLEAIAAGADEALMLDPRGFVSSCNATNFFFVTDGEVRTSTGDYCFNGVTRGARDRALPPERASRSPWATSPPEDAPGPTKPSSPAPWPA